MTCCTPVPQHVGASHFKGPRRDSNAEGERTERPLHHDERWSPRSVNRGPTKPVEERHERRFTELHALAPRARRRQFEDAAIEPLRPEHHPRAVPPEHLERLAATPHEHEERARPGPMRSRTRPPSRSMPRRRSTGSVATKISTPHGTTFLAPPPAKEPRPRRGASAGRSHRSHAPAPPPPRPRARRSVPRERPRGARRRVTRRLRRRPPSPSGKDSLGCIRDYGRKTPRSAHSPAMPAPLPIALRLCCPWA